MGCGSPRCPRYVPGRTRGAVEQHAIDSLEPMVAFDKACEAAGGYGERVEVPDELPKALERAKHAVTVEKRQALLHVVLGGA